MDELNGTQWDNLGGSAPGFTLAMHSLSLAVHMREVKPEPGKLAS